MPGATVGRAGRAGLDSWSESGGHLTPGSGLARCQAGLGGRDARRGWLLSLSPDGPGRRLTSSQGTITPTPGVGWPWPPDTGNPLRLALSVLNPCLLQESPEEEPEVARLTVGLCVPTHPINGMPTDPLQVASHEGHLSVGPRAGSQAAAAFPSMKWALPSSVPSL